MVAEKGIMAVNVAGCSHFFSEFIIFFAKSFILWLVDFLITESYMEVYTLIIYLLYIAILYYNYQQLTSSQVGESKLKAAKAEEDIFEIIDIQPSVEKCKPIKDYKIDNEVYDQFMGASVLVKVGDRKELPYLR